MSTEKTWNVGSFTWRDLMTDEPLAAKKFYGTLFGWSFREMPLPEGAYHVIEVEGRAIGGITQRPGDAPYPPTWTSYVSVEDVDATCAKAAESGGAVFVPPMDIPDVGRFAVIGDPAGAAFSVLRTIDGDGPLAMPPVPFSFCWESLVTTDAAKSTPFYATVLGWEAVPGPGGPDMVVFRAASGLVADVRATPPGVPSHFLTYVVVPDLDATRNQALALGAKILEKRVEVPKVGWICPMVDPGGATIGIFQPDMSGRS